jgi:hypothetical protein
MWYKLKRILIYPDGVTEKQVYPAKVVECDFKQSDNWFTYLWRSRPWESVTVGRDATHWLYATYNSTSNLQVFYSTPNTITSQWDIYKIEFYCYSTSVQNWAWFVSNATSDYMSYPATYVRFWYNGIDIYNNSTWTWTVVVDMPSWWYVATVDLDNLQCYTSNNPTWIATIPSAYAEVYKTLWHSGNFCIMLAKWWQRWTVYLEKVKFYVR